MDKKFTVIKSTEENMNKEIKRLYRIAKLNECWERQFFNTAFRFTKDEYLTIDDLPQDIIAKIGLSGVKYISSKIAIDIENKRLGIDEPKTLGENQALFQVLDIVFSVLGNLTLKSFVTTFPIRKDYDGDRWGCKDYFFIVDILSKRDWDKPIGRKNVIELLWDYQNDDLEEVYVEYMSVVSNLYRLQTGKGIVEQWWEDNGITTYTINDEMGIIKDNQTGEIAKFKKKSHLQVVK